jgi:putative ATP-binding cassette transporter
MLFFIFIGLTIFLLPSLLGIGVGTMTVYVFTTLYMKASLAEIMNILQSLGRASVSVKRVEDLGFSLLAYPQELESVGESDPQPSWERLELSGITHSYRSEGDEQEFALGPIDLTLYPGEIVFLVGGNSSGKTTLAKLITGLYAPDSGEIRLNGKLITKQNQDDYRQWFSAIFSEFYIFERFFGFEDSFIDVKAAEYLVKLHLEHKVKIKDGTLSSIDLSQGQRKRLALLTAYLEDRLIYLFDEWAADQDPFFKEVFYYQLLPELKARGKTTVVISHDDHYYKVADRIIKLDRGKLEFDRQVTHSAAS